MHSNIRTKDRRFLFLSREMQRLATRHSSNVRINGLILVCVREVKVSGISRNSMNSRWHQVGITRVYRL